MCARSVNYIKLLKKKQVITTKTKKDKIFVDFQEQVILCNILKNEGN